MADNGTPGTPVKIAAREAARKSKEAKQEAARQAHYAFVDDETNWEWVEIPETDLFDKPYGYIGLNTETYGPGKHFVDPDIASELKRIIELGTCPISGFTGRPKTKRPSTLWHAKANQSPTQEPAPKA